MNRHFERCLEQSGMPFVAVEDVRPMAGGDIGPNPFHCVVYPGEGKRNWLVFVGPRNTATVEVMAEWERVFGGAEFQAVFASRRASGWALRPLDEGDLVAILPNPTEQACRAPMESPVSARPNSEPVQGLLFDFSGALTSVEPNISGEGQR